MSVNDGCHRVRGVMKAVYEFKAECHQEGQQQKQSGRTPRVSPNISIIRAPFGALGKDQLLTCEATDATLQFRHIGRFELNERFDFIPVHKVKSFYPRAMKNILSKLDAHLRLFLALAVSLIVFILTLGRLQFSVQAIAVWNVFAWTVTVLAWTRIFWRAPRPACRRPNFRIRRASQFSFS